MRAESFIVALCTNCRPVMRRIVILHHHRPAMHTESSLHALQACDEGEYYAALCNYATMPNG